jgi:hypothetical protein
VIAPFYINKINSIYPESHLEHDRQLLALQVPQLDPLELFPDELPLEDIAKVDIKRSTFESLHLGQVTELTLLLERQSSSNSLSHCVQ